MANEQKQGPTTQSANEFAIFELARLGYDVATGREVHASTEDADDLVQAILAEPLEAAVYSGVLWAVRNRPVNWPLHLEEKTHTDRQIIDARLLGVFAGAELPAYDAAAAPTDVDFATALGLFDQEQK